MSKKDENDTTKISELLNKYPSNYIESIAFKSIYEELKEIKLSEILNVIELKANRNVSSDGMAIYEIKLGSEKNISISRRVTNAASLFSSQYFLKNYQTAFKNPFPQQKTYKSKLFPGLELTVINDLVESAETTISLDELLDFKFIVCLFFGIYFHIEMDDCICYPTSLRDWVAYGAGITKNCINLDCKNRLQQYEEEFDPMIHFDCGNMSLNYVFTMINQIGNQNKITLDLKQNDQVKQIQVSKI